MADKPKKTVPRKPIYPSVGPGPASVMLPSMLNIVKPATGVKKSVNRFKTYSLGPGPAMPSANTDPDFDLAKCLPRVSPGPREILRPWQKIDDGKKSRKPRLPNMIPGPGYTNVHESKVFNGPKAPSWWYRSAYNKPRKTVIHNAVPAPNAYTKSYAHTEHHSPAYKVYTLPVPRKIARQNISSEPPGPCYDLGDVDKIKPRAPRKVWKHPVKLKLPVKNTKLYGPGPNAYNLMEYKPGDKAPTFKVGDYHSKWAPPMIVRCDNIENL